MRYIKPLLFTLIISSLFGCSKKNKAYERDGNKIYFGYYPKKLEENDSVIKNLSDKIKNLPNSENSYDWIDYKFYIEDEIKSFMWYIDIDLDNDSYNDYRGVYFTSYRPHSTNLSSNETNSCQYNNGYYTNNIYWFKYEKIEWTILKENKNSATIISDNALDCIDYFPGAKRIEVDHDGVMAYENNYELSHVRKWLNNEFYNTAFKDKETNIINTTLVNNSSSNDGYVTLYKSNDTYDKVYILSREEALTYYKTNSERSIGSTEYSRCMGLYSITNNSAFWLLRTPFASLSNFVLNITFEGAITHSESCGAYNGIRPVIEIKL